MMGDSEIIVLKDAIEKLAKVILDLRIEVAQLKDRITVLEGYRK